MVNEMENRCDMMENHLTPYQSVITEIKSIISSGQEAAYSASSNAMLLTYWNIGKRHQILSVLSR